MKRWAQAVIVAAAGWVPTLGFGLSAPSAPLAMQGWVRAVPINAPASDPFAGRLVADASLDELRGGFEAGSTLRVAFGIERVVWVNGQMMATTTLNLGEMMLGAGGLRVFSGGQGGAATLNLGVIQIRPNNGLDINPTMLAGTVIQNSLNGQNIRTLTTINASVNSQTMLREARFGEAMREAMIGAMRR